MNIQVEPTRSNLASAMLNSKIRPRAVVGYGVKIFLPSPPNYVNRSPGYGSRRSWTKWEGPRLDDSSVYQSLSLGVLKMGVTFAIFQLDGKLRVEIQ